MNEIICFSCGVVVGLIMSWTIVVLRAVLMLRDKKIKDAFIEFLNKQEGKQ